MGARRASRGAPAGRRGGGSAAGRAAPARRLLVLAGLLALPAVATAAVVLDQGFYRVYQYDRLIGSEQITFLQRTDSLVVTSVVNERLPRPGARPDSLVKSSAVVFDIRDG